MNGLEKIIEKITQDAKNEANRYYENADMTVAHIKSEAIDRMMRMETVYADRTKKMSEECIARAQSSADMAYRNTLLAKKSEMIDLAFSEAEEKILSLPKEEYVEFMIPALVYTVNGRKADKERISVLFGGEEAELDSGYEIMFSERDIKSGAAKDIFDGASKKLKGVEGLKLSEKSADINGGFVLRCGDVETNCSVDFMIDEARAVCEKKVIEKLFS